MSEEEQEKRHPLRGESDFYPVVLIDGSIAYEPLNYEPRKTAAPMSQGTPITYTFGKNEPVKFIIVGES